eukprot:GDKJ01018774.1.p1 GENE.GDKJ01018774.1~~GDKJ01018774.1.p1  ORF type:complete len:452 (-),score=94.58 GDKJ01018774.1:36-1391(-)
MSSFDGHFDLEEQLAKCEAKMGLNDNSNIVKSTLQQRLKPELPGPPRPMLSSVSSRLNCVSGTSSVTSLRSTVVPPRIPISASSNTNINKPIVPTTSAASTTLSGRSAAYLSDGDARTRVATKHAFELLQEALSTVDIQERLINEKDAQLSESAKELAESFRITDNLRRGLMDKSKMCEDLQEDMRKKEHDLKLQLKEANQRNNDLTKEVAEYSAKLIKLQMEQSQQRSTEDVKEEYEKLLIEKHEELQRFADECENLKDELACLQHRSTRDLPMGGCSEECLFFRQQYDEMVNQIEKLDDELNHSREDRQRLWDSVQEYDTALKSVQADLEAKNAELERASHTSRKMISTMRELSSKLKEYDTKAKMPSEAAQQPQMNTAEFKEMSRVRAENEQLLMEIQSIKDALEASKAEIYDLRSTNESLSTTNAELMEENRHLKENTGSSAHHLYN